MDVHAVPGTRAEPGPLEARVRDSVAAVRGLESLYRESDDPREQAAALQNILARAAWLEQVGGLKDARADALLALARWDLLGFPAPLQYGFLAESAGAAQAEAVARRPRPGELPAALAKFEKRLLYLQVRNTSRRPLVVAGRPFVEVQRQLEVSRLRVPAAAELPAELQPFAAFFTWPERLAAGEVVQNLAWLPEADARILAVGVDVREEDGTEAPARAVRVVFLEAQDEEALKRTRREAERQEPAIREERKKRAREKAPAPPVPPRAVPPEPPKPPAEKLPKALGVVERAGADDIIQVRLNEGETFRGGAVLRVRRKNAWVGRVRMPEHQTPGTVEFGAEKDKVVFWATIIEGSREGLTGGTLHAEE